MFCSSLATTQASSRIQDVVRTDGLTTTPIEPGIALSGVALSGLGYATGLPLGPSQEALRLYLLGKTQISDGVVQLVTLSTALDELHTGSQRCRGSSSGNPITGATSS